MSADIFDQISIFQDLAPAQRDLLRPILVPCDYDAGKTLFEQGEPAENIFLVISGEVVVRYKPEDGEPINVTRIRAGGLVGWSAALGSRAYTSGAYCSEVARLVKIRGEDLRRLCETDHQTSLIVLNRLAAAVAERLHNTRDQVIALLEQGLRVGAYPGEN